MMQTASGHSRRKLVLFDIDGTLISSGRGARRALQQALHEIHGVRVSLGYRQVAGSTDLRIIEQALRGAAVSPDAISDRLSDVLERYLILLEKFYNADGDAFAYPGVPGLVAALARIEGVRLGLVTGNVEVGARIKLAPFALNDYFAFGAFGDDAVDRDALPPIAVQRAQGANGYVYRDKDIVVVGDTVHDVTCTRSVNGTSLVVIRRVEYRAEILAAGPDHVFDTFEDPEPVLEAILR